MITNLERKMALKEAVVPQHLSTGVWNVTKHVKTDNLQVEIPTQNL